MKRTAVIKKIRRAAKEAGVQFEVTEGGNHTRLLVGTVRTTIGRHSEVAEGAVEALYKQLEPALGKGWWKR
ncbi:hypothetical protein CLV30_101158 [Haloactinopolyspora alba]|uniref:HicA-like toxin of HicAB toxin-antitoxin system n=1 Tax=Haloactinopolyspora alba TaxID=648780 RepID=A0A2P8EFG8_9ACTN|nr:hypothetical protein [Haloactinopolyspora alba]PSL08191.1 hypothetical protein CLV30_101158 [Haloactinopolyspora alba]